MTEVVVSPGMGMDMVRLLGLLATAAIALGALGGCAHEACHCTETQPCVSGGASMIEASPTPGVVTINCPELPAVDQVEQEVDPAGTAAGYRVVSAEACQCLAAAHSTSANLLAKESQSVPVNRHGKADTVDLLKAQMQALRAIDERNRAGGVALEVFYHLVEGGMQRELLEHSLVQIRQALDDREELIRRGLAVKVDESELFRQKAEVLDQQARMQQLVRQAAAQVCRLLGLPFENGAPLSPSADLTIDPTPIDVEAAVVNGLANRADLAALRLLRDNASEDTLSLMQNELQQFEPLLAPSSKKGLGHRLCGGSSDEEVCKRQQQLDAVLIDRTREAEREIRHAVRGLETALRQVALAKERLESWRRHIADLTDKRESQSISSFEIIAAQLKADQAESDLVHAMAAWKIAQVKLKLAQGLLAWECGYRMCD